MIHPPLVIQDGLEQMGSPLVTHLACVFSRRHTSVASLLMTSHHGSSIICIMLTSAVTACRSCLRGETRWRAGQPNLRAGARALQHAWQLLAAHFSQTKAVGPPALPPPLIRGPRAAPVSSLGSARCLAPQARLLQIRWVVSSWVSNCSVEENFIIDTEPGCKYKYRY